jgi:DNA recombination protein RmuC
MLEILLSCIPIALMVIGMFVFQGKLSRTLEEKHRLMLNDLHDGLDKQGSRMTDNSERLRESMQRLQLSQHDSLAALSAGLQEKQNALKIELLDKTLQTLAAQGRAGQELIQSTMLRNSQTLSQAIEGLTRSTDARLEQISGKVAERLDEGFKKTNETFANVMARLATIDEAQKKIDGLTSNVVSLQQLLGDKRSRGAYGEVQLEGLVRNILPPDAYVFQEKLSNGNRVDCLLILPPPTGRVPVDAKFPLENYQRMLDQELPEAEKIAARRQFKLDIKKHIEDISRKSCRPRRYLPRSMPTMLIWSSTRCTSGYGSFRPRL